MQYQEVQVHCAREASEAVAELMTRLAGGVAVDDPLLLLQGEERGDWDYCDLPIGDPRFVTVTAYFPLTEGQPGTAGGAGAASAAAPLAELRSGLAAIAELGLGLVDQPALRLVAEEDWANAWKAYFHPFRVGHRIVVVPSWEEYREEPGDVCLNLDPGMAFGTGTHPTTALCLEALEERVQPGQRLLDVGCGSGILAIAAARLGAAAVLALDIDPVATAVAAANVERNGVAGEVTVRTGALAEWVPPGAPLADIIVSNIVADVIISLVAEVADRLAPAGTWLTGGIIAPRLADVEQALSRGGFIVTCRREAAGWATLEARRA